MDPREKTLDRLLEENDRLHQQATTAAQSLLASRAFAELTSCARRQATKLQTGLKNYDTASFVNKIKTRMSGDARAEEGDVTAPLDFASLGGSLWRYYRRAPAVDFMYGLADIQPRAPVVRKAQTGPRAGSKRGGVAARPENVVDKDKLDKTETDLQIEAMHRELQRRGGAGTPFYAFLVDPDSFSRSVENIFHSSFLIKDGRARLGRMIRPWRTTRPSCGLIMTSGRRSRPRTPSMLWCFRQMGNGTGNAGLRCVEERLGGALARGAARCTCGEVAALRRWSQTRAVCAAAKRTTTGRVEHQTRRRARWPGKKERNQAGKETGDEQPEQCARAHMYIHFGI